MRRRLNAQRCVQFEEERYKVMYKRPTDLALIADVPVCCNLIIANILDEGGWWGRVQQPAAAAAIAGYGILARGLVADWLPAPCYPQASSPQASSPPSATRWPAWPPSTPWCCPPQPPSLCRPWR